MEWVTEDHAMFAGLLAVAATLKQQTGGWSALWLTGETSISGSVAVSSSSSSSPTSNGFRNFQASYVRIFLLAMLADWMQGPYVYKLYAEYGYSQQMIAQLFVVGFGTAGIFGVIIGGIADRFGRRLMCLAFCVCYALACVTKHFHTYSSLMLGRFLGGVSTAILFSAFESYMVAHHQAMDYAPSLLNDTFRIAWTWNAIVAVAAGVITSMGVSFYSSFFGVTNENGGNDNDANNGDSDGSSSFSLGNPPELAAFDCSAIVLILCAVFILRDFKKENYGNTQINVSETIKAGVVAMYRDLSIIYLGCVQSCFEGAMFIFVFYWTKILEDSANSPNSNNEDGPGIDHGMIFANFMVCCMIGTDIFGLVTSSKSLSKWYYFTSIEKLISILLCVSSISMLMIFLVNNYRMRLILFFIFEVCVGCYWPAIGSLRSKYVPDYVRTTIMNMFRVPLNFIVVIVLLYIDYFGSTVFIINFGLLLFGVVCLSRLRPPITMSKSDDINGDTTGSSEIDMNGQKNTLDELDQQLEEEIVDTDSDHTNHQSTERKPFL